MLAVIGVSLLIAYFGVALFSGIMTIMYIIEHPNTDMHKQVTMIAGAVFWPIWIVAGFCWAEDMNDWMEK